jgi:hypothetical protein
VERVAGLKIENRGYPGIQCAMKTYGAITSILRMYINYLAHFLPSAPTTYIFRILDFDLSLCRPPGTCIVVKSSYSL